ncbi:MAG TPA: hypothetical protein ENI72_02650 [Rhodospirillales bacterium]|nr:hypothetical protein [Rhodospirillales bacterium]
MRTHITLIYNPVAGSARTRRKLDPIIFELNNLGVEINLLETTGPGQARSLAEGAIGQSPDALVIAGGDGTVSEAAGVLKGKQIPFAVIPTGTINLLARELTLPPRPADMARLIAFGPVRRIYPGFIGDKMFLVVAGVGFDALAIRKVSLRLKRIIGRWAYAVAAVKLFTAWKSPPYAIRTESTKKTVAGLAVANGLYYAGPFSWTGEASVFKPGSYVCLFKRFGRLGVIRTLAALLLNRVARTKTVSIIEAATIRILEPVGDPVHGDGDIVATVPATISSSSEPLMVIAPEPPPVRPGNDIGRHKTSGAPFDKGR